MLGLILGLVGTGGGLGLLAYLVGPAAIFAFLKQIPAWAYLAVAIIGLIVFLTISRGHAIDRYKADEVQLASICSSVRIAAGNPKLDCKQAGQQIVELGKTIATLKATIADRNAKVDALGKASADQQAAAEQASRNAQERARRADATASRLLASSRSGAHPTGSAAACEPSKALTDAWR